MTRRQDDITALVLAGGRGSRMGGVDKGLTPLQGKPLVAHIIERLEPQVAHVLINANRNAERYADFGKPVLADADPAAYAGPLAGMLAGLQACTTPWLLTAPCDSPWLPDHYAQHMLDTALAAGATVAMASDGQRHQPVFCLIKRELVDSLQRFLAAGDRKIDLWTRAEQAVEVLFEDSRIFTNINTRDDLRRSDPN